jgi:hypothetical protein
VVQAPSPPIPALNARPGLWLAGVGGSLGSLTDLAGAWVGKGFNLISFPGSDSKPPSTGPRQFRLKLNSTVEIVEVTPIGGAVPNRGSTGQDDIKISGPRNLHRVSDSVTSERCTSSRGSGSTFRARTRQPAARSWSVRARSGTGISLASTGHTALWPR